MRVDKIVFIKFNIDPPMMGCKENLRSRHVKTHIFKTSGLQGELRPHRLGNDHRPFHRCCLVFTNDNAIIRHLRSIKLATNAPFLMPDIHGLK